MITAALVETYRWTHGLRGFALFQHGARLPGMLTINSNDVAGTLAQEVNRYCAGFSWCKEDTALPMVEYTTGVTKVQAHRYATADTVTHGGSWMFPHSHMPDDEMKAAITAAVLAVA